MNKLKKYILIALLFLLPGCVSIREVPYFGLLYSNHRFAGNYLLTNDVKPARKERSCMRMILGLVAYGEAGAGKIAADRGIMRIAYVDHEFFNIFFFYMRYCTVVYGE